MVAPNSTIGNGIDHTYKGIMATAVALVELMAAESIFFKSMMLAPLFGSFGLIKKMVPMEI